MRYKTTYDSLNKKYNIYFLGNKMNFNRDGTYLTEEWQLLRTFDSELDLTYFMSDLTYPFEKLLEEGDL